MRTWAQWCVDHNLKFILYIACVFVQLPITLTIAIYRAIIDTFNDLVDNIKSIHNAE
jgi:hypothetical protein